MVDFGFSEDGKEITNKSPAIDRLKARLRWDGDCLVWTGKALSSGHGTISMNGKRIGIHRLMYQHTFGEIPEGLLVRHKCDNPPCVNPSHLELGTHWDNCNDKMKRGRAVIGEMRSNSELTEKDVEKIFSLKKSGISMRLIAKLYGYKPHSCNKYYKG